MALSWRQWRALRAIERELAEQDSQLAERLSCPRAARSGTVADWVGRAMFMVALILLIVAHLHGPLDLSTAPALDRALQHYLDDSTIRRMVLDLRDVSFVDCLGVTVLVRLAAWAQAHEVERPYLVGLSTRGRRVLELVEVIDMFALDDTSEGAFARVPDGAVR